MDLEFVKARFRTAEAYREFIGAENEDECMEDRQESKYADGRARGVLCEYLGVRSGADLQKMERKERNEALSKLKEHGLSVRQIERLTGISRNIIQRA